MLKFHPAPGAMPMEPFAPKILGQPKRYIGRRLNSKTGEYELTKQPYACEEGSREAARCMRFLRAGDLVPADAATRKALGLPDEKKPSKPQESD